jgi:hypothetical protein
VIRILVVLALFAGLLVWWRVTADSGTDSAGLPTTPVTAAEVSGRADAHLAYPNARVFKTLVEPEGPPTSSGDGPNPAYTATFMATNDSPSAVRAWFARELDSRGYSCYGGVGPTYAYQIDTYKRGAREFVWVLYVTGSLLKEVYGITPPQSRTLIEVDYVIRPESAPPGRGFSPSCYRPFPSPAPLSGP